MRTDLYWDHDWDHETDAPMPDSEPVRQHDLEEAYDDMLDEVVGPVVIGNLTYDASRVLREVDPIAYRCGYHEWEDAELQDGNLHEYDPEAGSA